jgi:hypothetical protein
VRSCGCSGGKTKRRVQYISVKVLSTSNNYLSIKQSNKQTNYQSINDYLNVYLSVSLFYHKFNLIICPECGASVCCEFL